MAKPIRVEYESKVDVGASDTGIVLLFGGLAVLGFGYLAYKSIAGQLQTEVSANETTKSNAEGS